MSSQMIALVESFRSVQSRPSYDRYKRRYGPAKTTTIPGTRARKWPRHPPTPPSRKWKTSRPASQPICYKLQQFTSRHTHCSWCTVQTAVRWPCSLCNLWGTRTIISTYSIYVLGPFFICAPGALRDLLWVILHTYKNHLESIQYKSK